MTQEALVKNLRELLLRRPRGLLRDPRLARLGQQQPLLHAELHALARAELENRALYRDLEVASRRRRQLFLCDYTLSLIHVFHSATQYHFDPKLPRRALETARRYAVGKASDKQLQAADNAAWDEWCRVCDVAEDAPWNACLGSIRNASPQAVWAATGILGYYRPRYIARGVALPTWPAVYAIAAWNERREQRAILQTISM